MASIIVSGSAAVQYDGRTLYPGANVYSVTDNFDNYTKYLADSGNSLVTISVAFDNTINLTEQHLTKTVDFSVAANKTIATHELFTVTGAVRMKVTAKCTESLVASANTGLISLGTEDAASGWIAGTSVEIIDVGEYWCASTAPGTNGAYTTLTLDKIVLSKDVGYEIGTAIMSTGVIVFDCYWTPLSADGLVVTGNLSAMA